jgi:hypothetical protein
MPKGSGLIMSPDRRFDGGGSDAKRLFFLDFWEVSPIRSKSAFPTESWREKKKKGRLFDRVWHAPFDGATHVWHAPLSSGGPFPKATT